jgi:hypothetical protein
MNKGTKIRIHNFTAKTTLEFGCEAWVLKKKEKQLLKAAQINFFIHLLRITKLRKEKSQCIRGKNGSTGYSKENKTLLGKLATTRIEDGHKQDTKTSVTI